nr:hypothetical protein [uncultured archaeon]
MEYNATFGIDCGVSQGFGVKYPDFVRREESFHTDTPKEAYRLAMQQADEFAMGYLSNPNTGLTIVRLLSLSGPGGNVPFDASEAVASRTTGEHLLALVSGDN